MAPKLQRLAMNNADIKRGLGHLGSALWLKRQPTNRAINIYGASKRVAMKRDAINQLVKNLVQKLIFAISM
jgi:hypothetical protein